MTSPDRPWPAIPDTHPGEYHADGCDCETVAVHILVVQAAALRAELTARTDELETSRKENDRLDDALDDVLEERDRAEELLDRFAYTVAPMEEIGEHSSMNCPWYNALEILENRLTPSATAPPSTSP